MEDYRLQTIRSRQSYHHRQRHHHYSPSPPILNDCRCPIELIPADTNPAPRRRRVDLTRMVAFPLKTVFTLFTFFAVANSSNCRYTGIILGCTLQLFTHEGCVTKRLGDSQIITERRRKKDDPCVCRPVDPYVGKNAKTLVFEPGLNYPAYFDLFSGGECLGEALPSPPVGFGGKMMFNLPKEYPEIASVKICGYEAGKLKLPKPKTAQKKVEEAKVKAKNTKIIHGTGIGAVWRKIKSGIANTEHGAATLVDGPLEITKTQAEELGITAGELGVIAGVAAIAL
ncbi:hypothetical protein BJ138DRAFT_1159265 [Hygrophoropsis aurantiaca]|uniref:Uncharacterized protein n=1 Tax=Hygrophoropsis aurantiaca TaxID=72124 RepID=A0ACB8A2V9_9AGAM|nr:hypothetical protein BJ138DRAFT_1159265 [Hygrophoropsis aurantiaca]